MQSQKKIKMGNYKSILVDRLALGIQRLPSPQIWPGTTVGIGVYMVFGTVTICNRFIYSTQTNIEIDQLGRTRNCK